MKQLVMGIPLYGFGWIGVTNNGLEANNPGLYASATDKLPNHIQVYYDKVPKCNIN